MQFNGSQSGMSTQIPSPFSVCAPRTASAPQKTGRSWSVSCRLCRRRWLFYWQAEKSQRGALKPDKWFQTTFKYLKHFCHVNVHVWKASSWLLCAPLCDGDPWCCWWSECDRWHTSASSLLSSPCRQRRQTTTIWCVNLKMTSREKNKLNLFEVKNKTKKKQSDACFGCFLKRTHLWLLPVESHVLVAATWPGMHCSYVGSPSSSAGGKHCSYDSWSSGINKTARLNKILVLSTTTCVQYVQPTCWLWQVMPQR